MVIEESRLKFEFPADRNVIKFDDTNYYRKNFNVLPEAKGVDFITLGKDNVVFLEVKNCTGDEGNCRWRIVPNDQKVSSTNTQVQTENRHSLDIEVAQKVAMSLAALSGVTSFSESKSSLVGLKAFAQSMQEALSDEKRKVFVILFLEGDFGCHSRSKKSVMRELQDSMNAKLKWLNCRVSVVDSDTYDEKLFRIAG